MSGKSRFSIKKTILFLSFSSVMSSAMAIDDYEIGILPTVTVTDSYIVDFDYWGGYNPSWNPTPFFNTAMLNWIGQYSGTGEEGAQLAAMEIVGKKASVCNAIVSDAARSTTSTSDVTSRWLAAQEVFNYMHMQNIISQWREYTGNIVFKIDGKMYSGFKVRYADGASETWAINPGYKTSSIKLLDSPMPNSLQIPAPHVNVPKCNVG